MNHREDREKIYEAALSVWLSRFARLAHPASLRDRIAKHTKQPKVLRELFDALGGDPFIIAECLARPLLAERMLATVGSLKEPMGPWRSRADNQTTNAVEEPVTSYNTGGRYNPIL